MPRNTCNSAAQARKVGGMSANTAIAGSDNAKLTADVRPKTSKSVGPGAKRGQKKVSRTSKAANQLCEDKLASIDEQDRSKGMVAHFSEDDNEVSFEVEAPLEEFPSEWEIDSSSESEANDEMAGEYTHSSLRSLVDLKDL